MDYTFFMLIDKKARIGHFVTQAVTGESFKAYVPPKLPPNPSLNLEQLYPALERATQAISELNGLSEAVPNKALLLYMYVRREALLSSQIEGTQSSFSDLMLFEHHQKPNITIKDVEEVSNYVLAMKHGLSRLKNDFPLCLRLLKEIHEILLKGARGETKLPGEFRRSQNWIGGTRPGNALFVPPPPEELDKLLGDFEKFLHDEDDLPKLIKAGLAHVQFETIHPFLDGNGRLGRLLIILMLCEYGLLNEPILYLSYYFKRHRALYYDLLQEVRLKGDWERWLIFFLEGIENTAKQTQKMILNMDAMFERDLAKIKTLGRVKTSCLEAYEVLKKLPQLTVPMLCEILEVSAPTARNMLHNLSEINILHEVAGHARPKIYVYKEYLEMLEEGAEPL